MSRRGWRFLLGLAITFALVIAGSRTYILSASFKPPRVVNVAPQEPNFLLNVTEHIRFTPRPEETFDFPIPQGGIGPTKSLYSGPTQYPFYCMTLDSGLGQPEIDNHQGYGVPVYKDVERQEVILGYSKDCGVKTQLRYYKFNDKGRFVNRAGTGNKAGGCCSDFPTRAWHHQQIYLYDCHACYGR